MAMPDLIAEVDFTGYPTASYYDQIINADGLVSYWRLDSASTLTDSLGLNTGTVTGTPSLVTGALPNDSNQALSFNGTTQDAYTGDTSSLTPSLFSLETWVKFAALPGATRDIAGKRGSYLLQVNSSGKVLFTVKNDTNTVTLTSNTTLATGAFYNALGVYDGVTAGLYINGILETSSAYASGVEVTSQPFRVAAFPSTAAPTWQSSQTASGTSTTATVTKPVSTASGDFLIAQVDVRSNPTVTAPTGWIQISNDGAGSGGTEVKTRLYYLIAGGSEPASYTWTLGASVAWGAAISRITGQDTTAPFANPVYSVTSNSITTITAGSHLPNLDNCLVLAFFSVRDGLTWTESAGPTERYDVAGIAMASQAQTTATSVTVTGTPSVAARPGTAQLVVIAGAGMTRTAATVDETTLWNTALTASDALSHYTARLSGVGAWVDISADVKQVEIRDGRQYELDRMEAGTATVVLNDLSRKYDPSNKTSPYYPNVVPNRKIRVRALLSGSYYPIFQGFVERWPTKWTGPNTAECTITATDAYEPLNRAGVSGSLAAGLAGAQINTILNKALWPAADRALDAGLFLMADDTSTGTTQALGVVQEIADSELGIFFMDHTAVNAPATFHDSFHRWSAARSVTSQATFSDQGTFISYMDLIPSEDNDKTINKWEVSTSSGATATASDVSSAQTNFFRFQSRTTRLRFLVDAETQATNLLQDTARPGYRFDSLTVRATDQLSLANWQKILGLAISDRVTVIRNPLPSVGGTLIQKDCFVEGRSWSIQPKVWQVSWPLSPVSSATYYETIVRDGPVSYWRMNTTT